MEEILDISIKYCKMNGERTRGGNPRTIPANNPSWSSRNPEPMPFMAIFTNHSKHAGRIYREASMDKSLWQDSRFRIPLGSH